MMDEGGREMLKKKEKRVFSQWLDLCQGWEEEGWTRERVLVMNE